MPRFAILEAGPWKVAVEAAEIVGFAEASAGRGQATADSGAVFCFDRAAIEEVRTERVTHVPALIEGIGAALGARGVVLTDAGPLLWVSLGAPRAPWTARRHPGVPVKGEP